MAENIERKIDVKEFVHRYDLLKTDEQKNNFVESIIWRKYCPVLEKKVILQTMLNKTIVTSEDNISHIDYFLSKVNIITTILLLYTKLDVKKDDSSEVTAFDDYDMLFERDLINQICAIIGENELNELMTIQGLLIDNYTEENKTIEAYIARYINMFATTIGIFANEGATQLLQYLKDNNIKLDK